MSHLLHSLADLKTSECHFCAYEQHQSKRYLEGIANDGVNDPPLRRRLRHKGGFCQRHLKVFASQARILSSAILLEDLLNHHLERARLGKAPRPVNCEACQTEQITREHLAKTIRRTKDDPTVVYLLLKQDLCMTHLELVTQQLHERQRYAFLDKYQQLLNNLSEVIRKHDYRFVSEGISEEETWSVSAAIKHLK